MQISPLATRAKQCKETNTKTKRKSFTNFRHKNDEMADCEKSHSDPPRFIYTEEKMKRRNRKKFYPNIYFV